MCIHLSFSCPVSLRDAVNPESFCFPFPVIHSCTSTVTVYARYYQRYYEQETRCLFARRPLTDKQMETGIEVHIYFLWRWINPGLLTKGSEHRTVSTSARPRTNHDPSHGLSGGSALVPQRHQINSPRSVPPQEQVTQVKWS